VSSAFAFTSAEVAVSTFGASAGGVAELCFGADDESNGVWMAPQPASKLTSTTLNANFFMGTPM
jgi:hypothetical protein